MDRSRDQCVASSSEKDDATTKLRQGSILPRSVRHQIGLSTSKGIPDPILVIISHDCDLARPYKDEPHVELIQAQGKDELDGGLANGKNPRTLHLEYEQNGTKKVFELSALNKDHVDKRVLFGVDPDPDSALSEKGVEILKRWLAARYNRAAFPDDLDSRMKPIKKKLRSVDSKAIFGIWIKYEPVDNRLSDETPYELWVKLVYSTQVSDGRESAEQEANKLRLSFEKEFLDQGLWHSIDLRACEAVADTVFSVRDMYDYKQWRLEHLSLKQDPPGECI